MPADLVEEYLYRLRSPAKQDYARRYLQWLKRHPLNQGEEPEPDRGALSLRSAQLVQHHLKHLAR